MTFSRKLFLVAILAVVGESLAQGAPLSKIEEASPTAAPTEKKKGISQKPAQKGNYHHHHYDYYR